MQQSEIADLLLQQDMFMAASYVGAAFFVSLLAIGIVAGRALRKEL